MPSVRITVKGPDGKQYQKTIKMLTATSEETEAARTLFREHITAGKPVKDFMYYPLANMPSGQPASEASTAAPTKAPHSFSKGDVLKIDMPTNGGCSFLLLGSTRSGKSTAMLAIYEKYFKKHITMLLTHSSHADIYKPLQKTAIISPGFHPELVNEPMTLNRETKNKYEFCLIFDDLAMDGKNDLDMTKLLTIGRNSCMSAIICAQRLQMLNPSGRANCNYVCLFRLNTDSAIKDAIETYLRSYLPSGMSMNDAIRLYKETTADHHFFLVNTLEDTVEVCRV
jgi:hypothetical protein